MALTRQIQQQRLFEKLEKQVLSLVRNGTTEALADVAWRVELLRQLNSPNTPMSLYDIKTLSSSARVQGRVPQERGFLPGRFRV